MPIRHLLALLVLLPVSSFAAGAVAPAPQQPEHVFASFVLARGRLPSNVEVEQWIAGASRGLTDLMTRHRQQLQGDATEQQAVRNAAERDAFGHRTGTGERAPAGRPAETYTELMQRHLERLRRDPDEYQQVVQRAYQLVLRRGAYDLEFAYWKKHDTLSYLLLVGCIEDWARRNQPGLMVTAGTPTISANSRFLTTFRLSAPVAAEARAVLGLPPTSDAVLASSRTVLAVGAESVVSHRGIPFLAFEAVE
jgi:hypothetical protein